MPSAFATDALLQVMADVGTPAVIDLNQVLPAKGAPYTHADLFAIHYAFYTGSVDDWIDDEGKAVLQVLYLDGNFSGETLYGLVPRGFPIIAMFPDGYPNLGLYRATIQLPLPLEEGFERTVLLHEYGHVLGLVGCGLPELRARQNMTDECHSTHEHSVMLPYVHQSSDLMTWAVDDGRQPIWRFDEDDWADIRAGQARLSA